MPVSCQWFVHKTLPLCANSQQTTTAVADQYHLLTGWNMNRLINRQAKPCMIAKTTIIFHLVADKDRQAQLQRLSCRLGVV